MTFFDRESLEVEALRTDRYLDALLGQRDGAGRDAGAGARPDGEGERPVPAVDPAMASAIASLDRTLVRVHPSFRFEERLARRLTEVADAMRLGEAAGAEGAHVPVPLPFDPGIDPADPAATDGGPLPPAARPLLIGALSLAGAAIVVWRFGRPGDPMARAVRAASQLRGMSRPHGARID